MIDRRESADGYDNVPRVVRKTPLDGSVLLGRDEAASTCVFATRYHLVDRDAQRDSITQAVLYGELLQCCSPNASGWRDRTWGFLQSELLLVALHITVLTIGLIKVFIHTAETHEQLHLIHAVIETVLTCTIVIIRAFQTKFKFHEIKHVRLKLEFVKGEKTRGQCIKIYTFGNMFISFLLASAVIASFVICFLFLHMGWITLTNMFIIVISDAMNKISGLRYDLMMARIEQDHRTMVLLEAQLLLGELYYANTRAQNLHIRPVVERFLRGLGSTPEFHKPAYIECADEEQIDFITNMESGV